MNWLLRDEHKEVFDFVVAAVLCLLFLGVSALVLLPMGKAGLIVKFAQGLGLFWLALSVTAVLLQLLRRIFRIDMYSHYNSYVISALIVSCFWQVCWSAFAATVIQSSAFGGSWWLVATLYFMALVSCYVAFVEISAFYQGQIYRLINAPLALLSFAIFSVWPSLAQVTFGWSLRWL